MKIHFVCTGNTFRSRLAENYLKSKKIKNLEVSSSGIKASNNVNGVISWYAQRIMKKEGIIPENPKSWQETTKEILDDQDLVVFIKKEHYDFCKNKLGFNSDNYEVWDIPDITVSVLKTEELDDDVREIKKSELIFNKIKDRVNSLISRLK